MGAITSETCGTGTALPRSAKRLFGVGRRNALPVPFSTECFREFCRAGVICLYWVGSTTEAYH